LAKDAPKPSHFQEEKIKPKPKEEPILKAELPKYVNTKSEYQSDYSSKSQFNDKPTTANNDYLNNLLGKSQKEEAFPIKGNQQMSYTNPSGWQSPIDAGFGSKTTTTYNQPNNYLSQQSTNAYGVSPLQQSNYGAQPIQSLMPNNPIQVGPGFTQSNSFNNFNAVGSYTSSTVGGSYGNNIPKPASSFYDPPFDSKI
jgi:hypothetical protein